MNLRAVIFDIYGTLLEVGPPPPDAEARWESLCRELLGAPPRLSRVAFSIACQRVIARQHQVARALGIRWPEVQWPDVVREVVPELARLPADRQEEFFLRHVQTGRTLKLRPATVDALRRFQAQPGLLGIASNAQAYTVRELTDALAPHRLGLELFATDLRVWSFEHGFSKPDPHMFRILTARLAARGIRPEETLMIGDRLDNDVEPARAFGWQTWQIRAGAPAPGAGDWAALFAQGAAGASA